MYYKLDTNEYRTIMKIQELTNTDYEVLGNLIPVDSLMSCIDELLTEVERLQGKVKDLEDDIEQNYELKRTSLYEEYGVSERDFY